MRSLLRHRPPAPLWRVLTAAVALAAAGVGVWADAASRQATTIAHYPGARWESVADVRAAGYCADRLEEATRHVASLPTTGAMAIVNGRVLWQHGDVAAVSYLASVRKSILATMFGRHVESGRIRLDATLLDLGIDDVGGLLPAEKQATVADLLAARSGVYHEASNAACAGCGSTAGPAPPRGSVPHGTYFLYNNWDFNALGTIFEQATGQNIYDAFEREFAVPMGFEDFQREAQRKSVNIQQSIHPAYHFYLSTRDMARFGYLILRRGVWSGRALVPPVWVDQMTRTVTPLGEMNPESYRRGPFGYGYLWWTWDGPANEGIYRGAFTGIGAIGQYITVLPALDLVVVHKTRPGRGDAVVGREAYLGLVERIAAARCGA